ncbi:hypothetical protein IFM89_003802 [Coptis chinensis]|uniref:Uncharacterized protein n=1 Tax=Coptis chinensis TaxID=261450 RepID=A0A835IAJ9_9MAGN|nr:hypothetical protein IFM89_003802 [Coptis chinensis]
MKCTCPSKSEKNELRYEKQRLKAEKEKLEQQVKAMSSQPSFMPYPSAIPTAFAPQAQAPGNKAIPFIGYLELPCGNSCHRQRHLRADKEHPLFDFAPFDDTRSIYLTVHTPTLQEIQVHITQVQKLNSADYHWLANIVFLVYVLPSRMLSGPISHWVIKMQDAPEVFNLIISSCDTTSNNIKWSFNIASPKCRADEMRKSKHSRRIEVPVHETVYSGMTKAQVLEAHDKELRLVQQDQIMERTKDKKNALEAYVYDMRNKKSLCMVQFTLSGKFSADCCCRDEKLP